MSESGDSGDCTPPDILKAASNMTMNLYPAKSRSNYNNDPHTEGRAGAQAVCLDTRALAAALDHSLPSYARPLFLRLMHDIEITSTFKLKKRQYQKEGFDPDVIKDPLFFRSGDDFAPLTSQLFDDISNGRVKL